MSINEGWKLCKIHWSSTPWWSKRKIWGEDKFLYFFSTEIHHEKQDNDFFLQKQLKQFQTGQIKKVLAFFPIFLTILCTWFQNNLVYKCTKDVHMLNPKFLLDHCVLCKGQ